MMQNIEMQYIDQLIKNEILNYDIKSYVDTGKLPDNYYNDSMNKRYHYIDNNFKEELRLKGLSRAKEFTWLKCAKKTLEIIENI